MIDRRQRARAITDLVGVVMKPAVERHGLATSEIIARWPEIVGERLGRVTRPIRVVWPRRGIEPAPGAVAEPGTLVVGCESAAVLEVQYAGEAILDRVNALYGWRAIARISLRQGPIARPEPQPAPRLAAAPPVPEKVAEIEDENLRRALHELGRGVAARRRVTGS
jgi:hypothetical protein